MRAIGKTTLGSLTSGAILGSLLGSSTDFGAGFSGSFLDGGASAFGFSAGCVDFVAAAGRSAGFGAEGGGASFLAFSTATSFSLAVAADGVCCAFSAFCAFSGFGFTLFSSSALICRPFWAKSLPLSPPSATFQVKPLLLGIVTLFPESDADGRCVWFVRLGNRFRNSRSSK